MANDKWQIANVAARTAHRFALCAFAVCPFALCYFAPGCCVKPKETLDSHGPPDIVYELRGNVGRWYWYGVTPPATIVEPTEVGLLWLDEDHQATFADECRTYDGPIKSDDWRRFEQARSAEVDPAP